MSTSSSNSTSRSMSARRKRRWQRTQCAFRLPKRAVRLCRLGKDEARRYERNDRLPQHLQRVLRHERESSGRLNPQLPIVDLLSDVRLSANQTRRRHARTRPHTAQAKKIQ
ncbi:unnamed protein product [Nesidiocoris tenuis]|uniref:Uncharacterized protein n=1 Tax=Nesidiocoris tenuis TaxID=355587 RepID=A0A6H5FXW2_9HEMI|nr:unnamed protein product [Nesidiocoris tenuis]